MDRWKKFNAGELNIIFLCLERVIYVMSEQVELGNISEDDNVYRLVLKLRDEVNLASKTRYKGD